MEKATQKTNVENGLSFIVETIENKPEFAKTVCGIVQANNGCDTLYCEVCPFYNESNLNHLKSE